MSEPAEVKATAKYAHCSGYVAVHACNKTPGNTIYVIINERPAFDLIDLPENNNGKVLTKVIDYQAADAGPQYLIFQYWLEKLVAAGGE